MQQEYYFNLLLQHEVTFMIILFIEASLIVQFWCSFLCEFAVLHQYSVYSCVYVHKAERSIAKCI